METVFFIIGGAGYGYGYGSGESGLVKSEDVDRLVKLGVIRRLEKEQGETSKPKVKKEVR
jgi:hypothetical protein